MGVMVNVFEELRDRLATAQSSGDLTAVRAVRVASLTEARKLNDFPFINMRMLSGLQQREYQKAGTTEVMTIEIRLFHPKLESKTSGNELYKTSDSTGFLFLFEKLLNVLDKDTSGNINSSLDGTANTKFNIVYDIEDDHERAYEGVIELEVQTRQFQAGGR